mmetsp:Transcript_4203/g.6375  ORF Transcript_4203/g.6375 Transcript_4203/m.6375 type:complete len:469 (+) Transcript_4203:86-1492(+)
MDSTEKTLSTWGLDESARTATMDIVHDESQPDDIESDIIETHSLNLVQVEDQLPRRACVRRLSIDRSATIQDRARNNDYEQTPSDFHAPFLGEGTQASKRMFGTRQTSTLDRGQSSKTNNMLGKTIQPGRRQGSMQNLQAVRALPLAPELLKKGYILTVSQLFDFFKKLQLEHILLQVALSCSYTAFVIYACKDEWKDKLQVSTLAVAVLGAFLSFALVFRTQTCYARWWEGRTQWGIMIYASIHTAQQGRSWIRDEELVEDFLVYCILFSYTCKAMLRGNSLAHEAEEGPELVKSGMLSQQELDDIVECGWQPMCCIERLRDIMNRALNDPKGTNLIGEGMRNGAMKSMEDSFRVLATNLGACLKVKSAGLPLTYDLFTSIFIHVFFVVANLAWAPTMLWYTPIVTGVIVFLMNTVVVIGNQMLGAFELQWAALPLQKFCTLIENEINCIKKRHTRDFVDRNNNKKV